MPRHRRPIIFIMITLQQYILAWIHRLRVWFQELVDRFFGQVLSFEDSQIRVRVGRPLAEGGFSVVLRAVDLTQQQHTHHKVEYALKRIQCHDEETRQVCLHEAQVHQALQRAQPQNAKYLMPLYGMTWADDNNNRVCYMLFPLFPYSLRAEVHRRILNNPDVYENRRPPWNSESVVLQIFQHLLQAVATMHSLGYAHCDIKLDNILCKGSNVQHLTTPVLMDFGSAQTPLHRSLRTRQDVLDVVDTASQHTTVSYRPPELFAGELRAGDDTTSNSNDLDYAKVDVWSCGCVLFAILFGASPCESEFHRRTGRLQIVDCTQLKVLQDRLPQPPADLPPAHWYSPQLLQLVEWILTKDRHQRPTIPQVQARVNHLLNGNNGHGGDIETQSSNPSFFETEPFAPFNGRSMTY